MRAAASIFGALVAVVLLVALAGCQQERPEPTSKSDRPSRTASDTAWTPGLGMQYGTGRIGVEISPGIVMVPGKGMSLGFGF